MASVLELFGNVVRQMRTDAGFSQESFADVVGVHRNYIGTVERGETNITLENIVRLSKGLKQPIWVMFREMEHSLGAPSATLAADSRMNRPRRGPTSYASTSPPAPSARVAERRAELREVVAEILEELGTVAPKARRQPRKSPRNKTKS